MSPLACGNIDIGVCEETAAAIEAKSRTESKPVAVLESVRHDGFAARGVDSVDPRLDRHRSRVESEFALGAIPNSVRYYSIKIGAADNGGRRVRGREEREG